MQSRAAAGILCFCILLSVPLRFVYAQTTTPAAAETASITEKARVLSVENSQIQDIPGTETSETTQMLSALVLSGPDTGQEVDVENDYITMQTGDTFFLTRTTNGGGSYSYTVLDVDRLPALGILLAIFIIAVVLVGGWTGLRGLLALAASILLVFYALLPGITAGYNPIVVSFAVAAVIVVFGSYLTHGANRTTSAAVAGLVTTVAFTAAIAHYAIVATQLTGLADENAADLNFAANGHINVLGLLLGAMLIGALGILYDAAISQAVAVEELRNALPGATRWYLFSRAMRIGREHIGALVNTLAIAYVGVALPLLLLFQSYGGETFLQTVNREIFATEIVRALVGSMGIVLAVPITTAVAVFILTRPSSKSATLDAHGHHHA